MQYGSNVSHSKVHTKRRWMPNIHPATLIINGRAVRGNYCTRCIRSQQRLVH
ncbi:MAG: 50S ribosomal protein L28 [Dehalococcoidia bacterium]|nr:50S ribosomal protein L28 [Dehalococcoidia bacterium]